QAQQVREAARSGRHGEAGRISVGFVGSAISDALPSIIPAFRALYPKVDLRLEEMTSAAIVPALVERQIDVGLVRLPLMQPTGLQIEVIEEDELVVALRTDHDLARQPSIRLADLKDQPLVLHGAISVLRSVVILACQDAG